MYLMKYTRPDLAYPLSLFARYVAPVRHRKEHWPAAQRLTYLLSDLGERHRSPPVLYQRVQLRLSYMASWANTVDVFTKALGFGDHQRVSHVTPQSSPPQRLVPVVCGGAGGPVAEGEGTGAAGAGGVGSGGAGVVGVEVTPVEVTRPTSRPGFPSVPQFPPCSSLRPVAAEPGGVPAGGTGGPGGVGGGGAGSGGAGAGGTSTVAPTPRTVRFLTREQRLLRLEREERERFERAQQQEQQQQQQQLPQQQQQEIVEEESQLHQERVEEEPRPHQERVEQESCLQQQVQLQTLQERVEEQSRPHQERVEQQSHPQQQVLVQTQQERVDEDSRPQRERVAQESRSQQRVQLQSQQERAEAEPQEQQQGPVPSQQTPKEAEQQRLRLRDLPDPAPARFVCGPLPSPPVPLLSPVLIPVESCPCPNGPFHLVLRSRVPSPPVLPHPHESSLTVLHDPLSDYLRASRPVVSRVFSTLVTHPTAPLSSVSALVTTVAGFASSHRLDYAAHFASGPARSPSSGGAPVFPLEVLEDRQFELGFLAATVPHLCAMLLTPERDPDALDIPIPRNHDEAVSGPWVSQDRISTRECCTKGRHADDDDVQAQIQPRTQGHLSRGLEAAAEVGVPCTTYLDLHRV
ncbi:unnamed protein product [Closterium sp. NIES-53]